MGTFSLLLAICVGNSPVPSEFPYKGQWCWALMFSLICAWINGWVNNGEAGDLRRHRAHYDIIVMDESCNITILLQYCVKPSMLSLLEHNIAYSTTMKSAKIWPHIPYLIPNVKLYGVCCESFDITCYTLPTLYWFLDSQPAHVMILDDHPADKSGSEGNQLKRMDIWCQWLNAIGW